MKGTLQNWHERNHRRRRGLQRNEQPWQECWECGRLRAICRAKVRYVTREEADADAEKLNDMRNSPDDLVNSYSCRWCEGLHLTRATGKKAKRARRKWIRRKLLL